MQKAIFSAGCFWGVEEAFQQTPGVIKTQVGYTGGNKVDPTYEEVCSDTTGHAESVEVEFDENKISYEKLLERFWSIHSATVDPKWKEMIGRQYQSVIFYLNEDQQKMAEKKKRELELTSGKEISTTIEPVKTFYRAEERHQNYLAKRKKKAA